MMKKIICYLITWLILLYTAPLGIACTVLDIITRNNGIPTFNWKRFWEFARNGDLL